MKFIDDTQRMLWIGDVLEKDDTGVYSKAYARTRWLKTMLDILELPVPTWNDPGTVSGEIDTTKENT